MSGRLPFENISLLWADPDRAPSLAALHAAAFADAWSARAICDLLEADNAIAFVASINQAADVVGFIIGRQLVNEAEIITLGVVPDVRRLGIGARVLQGFETAAKSAGARRVILEVSELNVPARRLYESAGYSEIARRPGYYRGANGIAEDALVLERYI